MKILTYSLGGLSTNCHVVINDKNEGICFDIGGESGFLKLKEIQENFSIKAVFLTHGHFDHILGVYDFIKGRDIKVYISKKEEDFITNSNLNLSEYFGESVKPFNAILLNDNEIVNECGFIVKAILTPGHTSGSMSYKIGDLIFSGDLIFKGGYGRIDFPTGNASELIKSCKKIFEFKGSTIYSGHGESTTVDEEILTNPINYYD